MAGHHYQLATDASLQKLSAMRANQYKYFRWTPRTARVTFMYAAVVPAILGIMAYSTDGKYEIRAKRKGDLAVEY